MVEPGWLILGALAIIALVLIGVSELHQNRMEARCEFDCKRVYNTIDFKIDIGGFGSNECWCYINNEAKQVW